MINVSNEEINNQPELNNQNSSRMDIENNIDLYCTVCQIDTV